MKAFPSYNDADKQYNYINKGMDLRDYFAAKAMQSLIADERFRQCTDVKELGLKDALALHSYNFADAMVEKSKA
jgi:hypothetical protein